MLHWLGGYAVTLFWSWYGLLIALVGLVRIVEWFVGKTLIGSSRTKLLLALVLVFVAQASAYRTLQDQLKALRAVPAPAASLRRPIEQQADVLRECIRDVAKRTGFSEMWLSQIFRGTPPVFPTGPEVDVPAALRYLGSRGEVEVLETMARPYQAWYEVFNEDIRFKVKALANR